MSRAPVQIASLDPWTYPILVHWSGGITKLDFVGHRYMVVGKDQDLEDVLGDDLLNNTGGYVRNAAQQRSWVGAQGLDLRSFNFAGINAGANRAYLRNKTAEPDNQNPGALNEFLRSYGTYVIEFDWVDIQAELEEQSPGGFPTGVDITYDILSNRDNMLNYWAGVASVERYVDYQSGVTAVRWMGFWEYYTTSGADEEGFYLWHVRWVDEMPDPTGEYIKDDGEPRPDPYHGFVPFLSRWQPHDEPTTAHSTTAETDLQMRPKVAVYDVNALHDMLDGRMIGAVPERRFETFVPMETASTATSLTAPYGPVDYPESGVYSGRNRLAFTVTGKRIIASINGSDPILLKGDAEFDIPREYPLDEDGQQLTYFPIEPHPTFPTQQKTYEVQFQLPGFVRCVWHYRSPKSADALKKLSVVKPLTPPDDPAWKRT